MGPVTSVQAWIHRRISPVLPKSRFARSVTQIASAAVLGQAITILISPILTRLYSPEDFGAFGVYAAVLGIVTVIASLRYEYALPLPEDDETAAHILVLCFGLLLGMTILSGLIIWSLRRQIGDWLNISAIWPYLWLIPVGIFGAGTYQILNFWAIRKRDFARIARTRIARGFGRAALQVGIGLFHSGPLGLILGQFAGETAGSTSLGYALWKHDWASFLAITFRGIRRAAARYSRFIKFSSWADLLESLGLQVPQILFAAFYGPTVAGWFALGQRVIASPLNIVVDSVAQVYFGETARMQGDPRAIKRVFLKLTGRLALIGGLPVTLICALAPWLFTVVFGKEWEMAGRYVQVLGVMFAIRFVTVPFVHTLNVLERQDLYALWEGTRLILTIGGLASGGALGVSHFGAVGIYTGAMLLSYLVLWGLSWLVLVQRKG